MDDAAEFCCADDVVQTNGRCFFRRCREVWWQVIAGRMRSFLVVMPTPDSAHMVKMFFGHDHKLIQALELQRLNESLDVGPQIW